MPEMRETKKYKIKYESLLQELHMYGISETEFNDYIYLLLDEIKNNINNEGKIPEYSYTIDSNFLMLYKHNGNNYLELLCIFSPIPEYVDDMAIDGSIMMPKSARASMNLSNGEYDVNTAWHEIFLENN